jgi:iron complex outermembrane receptor protein
MIEESMVTALGRKCIDNLAGNIFKNNLHLLPVLISVWYKSIVTLTAVLFSYYSLSAQVKNVTFRCLDENKPAPFISVMIKNLTDSNHTMLITDENGQCLARNLSPTYRYQIAVRQPGYVPYTDTLIIGVQTSVEIHLSQLATNLKGVTIEGTKGYISRVGPKLLVNVQELKKFTNETSILGILNYAPGVIVDGNQISLNGRPGTKILIDGRDQLNLTNQQLKTILAENVRSIEIIENPSAQFDASGTGGVINIITRKNFSKRFVDTFNPTYTRSRTNSASLNNDIILSTDRLLINSSVSYINNGAVANKTYFQTSSNNIETFRVNDDGRGDERSRYASASAGFDYKITERQVLSGGASIFHTNGDNYANSIQQYEGKNTGMGNSAMFNSYNGTDGTNSYFYLGLNTKLDTLQSARKIFIDFTTYKSDLAVDNRASNPSRYQLTRGDAFNHTKLISANLDYNKTLNKITSVNYGMRYAASFLKSNSQYNFSTLETQTGELQGTHYDEQQGAAYIDINRNYKRLSVSFGLRAEYLYFNNQFLIGNTSNHKFDKSYFNLFPTFNINYAATDNATYSLFGGKRIIRPPYSYFSPYIKVINNFSYFTGNPSLVPSFIYNIGSSLLLRHQYSFSFSYAYTAKTIGSVQNYDQSHTTTIYSIANLGGQHNLNLSAYVPVKISAMINLRLSSAAFFNKYHNTLDLPQYKPKGSVGYYARINGAYEISESLTVNSTYYYLSAYQQLQLKRSERSYLDIGCNYTIKPDKFSFRLSFNDILWKYNSSERMIAEASSVDTYNRYDTRKIELGLTYSFGQMKSGRRTNSSQNENRYRLN